MLYLPSFLPFFPYHSPVEKRRYLQLANILILLSLVLAVLSSLTLYLSLSIVTAVSAPHEGETEPIFPATLRPDMSSFSRELEHPGDVNWRFKVPDGRSVTFVDGRCGPQTFTAGEHFGDFVVWSASLQMPSYELAVVVDDGCTKITEVVRGEDLLMSTARQLLLYEALNICPVPSFYHCPLVRDAAGKRMAKRDRDDATLRGLREAGWSPERIREEHFRFDNTSMYC